MAKHKVYRYRAGRSSYFTVGRALPAAGEAEALALVEDPSVDPTTSVVLTGASAPEGTIDGKQPPTVDVLSEEPAAIRLRVPAGETEVVFWHVPRSFRHGLLASLASTLVGASTLAAGRRRASDGP